MAKNKGTDSTDKAHSFESYRATLENLINGIEQGELSLEESLNAFEEGIKLILEAQKSLSSAEQTVQLLLSGSEEPNVEPFSKEEGSRE